MSIYLFSKVIVRHITPTPVWHAEDIINKISSLLALKPDQYSPDDIVQLILK